MECPRKLNSLRSHKSEYISSTTRSETSSNPNIQDELNHAADRSRWSFRSTLGIPEIYSPRARPCGNSSFIVDDSAEHIIEVDVALATTSVTELEKGLEGVIPQVYRNMYIIFLSWLWSNQTWLVLEPSLVGFYPRPCRGRNRPPCMTMPWNILPTLSIFWGVCWMFYTPPTTPCADDHFIHPVSGSFSSLLNLQTGWFLMLRKGVNVPLMHS